LIRRIGMARRMFRWNWARASDTILASSESEGRTYHSGSVKNKPPTPWVTRVYRIRKIS
jgi:hypothetical protein